ncbi:MAG: hypothetical protein ACK5LC_10095, partial [Coprobacillaceae bacterium]
LDELKEIIDKNYDYYEVEARLYLKEKYGDGFTIEGEMFFNRNIGHLSYTTEKTNNTYIFGLEIKLDKDGNIVVIE